MQKSGDLAELLVQQESGQLRPEIGKPLVGPWQYYARPPAAVRSVTITESKAGRPRGLCVSFCDAGYARIMFPLESGYPEGTRISGRIEFDAVCEGKAEIAIALLRQEGHRSYKAVITRTTQLSSEEDGQLAFDLPADKLDGQSANYLSIQIGCERALEFTFHEISTRIKRRDELFGFDSPDDTDADVMLGTAAPAGEVHADIVVCVHNALEDTRRCLESLVKHTANYRLIIVNDGSDEETSLFLRTFAKANPGTLQVRHRTARGYTLAANQGLRYSTAEFVVLLNSDTIVTKGWLEGLIRCARACPWAGIIGPLSNAASWQSIPELKGPDGKWCVNELPAGVSAERYAFGIRTRTDPIYPQVGLVNGFCYMIARRVIDAIGTLDGKTFPTGYGEEDDFSLRAQDKGFGCVIADDVYVFHAKSKSFTPERRTEIVKEAKGKLARKYATELIDLAREETQFSEDLLRARVHASLSAEKALADAPRVDLAGLRIVWVQPHLNLAGAIRRTIEMTNRMKSWGGQVAIATPSGERTNWMNIDAEVKSIADAETQTFDVVIYSDPDMIEAAAKLRSRFRLNYHLAAYMLYRNHNDELGRYYRAAPDIIHIANSDWTAQNIRDFAPDVQVAAVVPGGINHRQFRPIRIQRDYDVGFFGSRRRLHKGTLTIQSATIGLRRMSMAEVNAPQDELATWMSRCRVFASGAWHEGFNFVPLEAMACGVPVAMTDDGGSRQYARDGYNAMVVPVRDTNAMRRAIERLLVDRDLRFKFIENGLRTAWKFDWDSATASLAGILKRSLAERS